MNKKVWWWIVLLVIVGSVVATDPVFVTIQNNHEFNVTQDENFVFFIEGNDTEQEYPLNFSDTSEEVMAVFEMDNHNDTHAIINFTPTNSDVGYYTFFIVVEDTAKEFDTIRVFFNITNVNDAPNITSFHPIGGNLNTTENGSIAFNYTASDPDIGLGDNLTARWLLDGVNQSSEQNWTYVPGFCDAGLRNITLNVSDLSNAFDIQEWNVTVNNTNRPPINNGTIANQSWSEDTNLTDVFDLDDFFVDNDTLECTGSNNDTLTFTAIGNSSVTVVINASTHQVALIPDANWFGTEYIVIIVNDTISTAQSNNITLNVSNINDAPQLDNISNKTLAENVSFTTTIAASDPDNVIQPGLDNLTFYDNTTLFNINSTTGVINFTPSTPDIGNHTVNITVGDGSLNDSQIVVFEVQANNPPALDFIENQVGTENTLFTLDVNASDSDGDPFMFYDNATFFIINESTGIVNFTPVNDDVGNHSITITVNDSKGAVDSQVFNLTITDVNNAPLLDLIQNQTLTVNKSYLINVTASDPDDDVLNFTDNATFFNITKVNDTLARINFTPQSSDIGNHTVNITVNDSLLTDSQLVQFNIIPNIAPILSTIGNQTLPEDVSVSLDLFATDENDDSLTFGSNSTLFNITFISNNNSVVNFTPRVGDIGEHWIVFNVTDGEFVVNETVLFNITSVNDIPYFDPPLTNLNGSEDQLFTYDVNATDEENATLTFSTNASFFTINSTTGIINFTPSNGDVGVHSIHINVSDGVNVNSTPINFTVLNLNDPPSILSFNPNQSDVSVNENASLPFNITVNDSDGDSLTFSWTLNGTEKNTSQNWTYLPGFDEAGFYNVTVTVNDGTVQVSQSWNVTVNNTNRPPTFGIVIHTDSGDFTVGALAQTSATNQPGNVTLDLQNATDYYSEGNFTSSAIDLKADSDVYDVIDLLNVTVTGTVPSGTALLIRTRTGEDGSTWSAYSSGSALASFKINSTDNRYVQYSANLTTTDTTQTPALDEVKVTFRIPDFTGLEDTKYINWIDLDDYFTDPDGNSLNYTVTSVTNLDVSITNASSQVTLTPDADWFGTVQVVFTANDSAATVESNNVTIIFDNVDEPAGTTSSGGGGGGGGGGGQIVRTVTRLLNISEPQFLELVIPGPLRGGPNATVIAPITLKNNGNRTLEDIKMSAETNATELGLRFTREVIERLSPNDFALTELVINTGNGSGIYSIKVIGKVGSPNVEDSGIIHIDVSENLTERVAYVRDLLRLNPECLELNEVVVQAENAMTRFEYNKADELLRNAIEGCRYLIAADGVEFKPPRLSFLTDVRLIVSVAVIVFLFVLVLIYRSMARFYKKQQ